jgi:KDO2-lipid IV(A) lauroyltransferase
LISELTEKDIEKYVKVVRKENLPKDDSRPSILLTGHFGNWEVLVRQFENFVNHPYVVYRKQNNPFLEKFFQSLRLSNGKLSFVEKGALARKLPEIVSKKATLGLLCDLKEDGLHANFLGRKAKIGLSVAKLICKYNFRIIPVRVDRYNKHYFNINVYPEMKFSKKDLEEKNYEKITLQIYKMYENWIAEHPSNWYWVHNRWSN